MENQKISICGVYGSIDAYKPAGSAKWRVMYVGASDILQFGYLGDDDTKILMLYCSGFSDGMKSEDVLTIINKLKLA